MDAFETVIERRNLKWFGHVLRMGECRWSMRLMGWVSTGRKKRKGDLAELENVIYQAVGKKAAFVKKLRVIKKVCKFTTLYKSLEV